MNNKELNELLEDCVIIDNQGSSETLMRIVLHCEENEEPYQVMVPCRAASITSWQHERYISRSEASQLIKNSWDCWKRIYTS
jgi:hypothetical protein